MELGNQANTLNRETDHITIWQQNINKSKICQHDLLSSARLIDIKADIIALQEPAISDFATTISTRDWRVIYPSTHAKDPSKTRSVILIYANILTNNWSQMDIDLGDIMTLRLSREWGTLTIYNIYNNCKHDETIKLLKNLQGNSENDVTTWTSNNTHMIWLGDFNRHHPYWDNTSDNRLFTKVALNKAEYLISAVADPGLDLVLPPKIPMHKHNVTKKWTRLDHVFLSDHSSDVLLSCEVLDNNLGPNTDHLPIVTKLDLVLTKVPERKIPNFRNINWEKFRKVLKDKLWMLGLPRPIKSQGELDLECHRLTSILQTTIQSEVPIYDLSPKSRQWWTKELMDLQREASKLGRKASVLNNRPSDPIHAQSTVAKKAYEKAIEYNKKHHWRDWLEKAEDPDIWTAHRYISAPAMDGSATRIPVLKAACNGEEVTASMNEDKSQILVHTFFPA